MGRKVILVPHNPDWIRQYDEAAGLTAVFQPILSTIQHTGSTAIPNIITKVRLWRERQAAI
ncbi:MAG: GrpB family protein [Chloroflexi bacterium]|nr:GrpB family protein [Chloroflexota bacterium]